MEDFSVYEQKHIMDVIEKLNHDSECGPVFLLLEEAKNGKVFSEEDVKNFLTNREPIAYEVVE